MRTRTKNRIGIALVAIVVAGIVASCANGRSLQATVISHVEKGRFSMAIYQQEKRDTSDKSTVTIPRRVKFPREMKEYRVDGMQVFEMVAADDDKPIIFYIHGGGYMRNFDVRHWLFMAEIAKDTGCGLVAPNYPLLPKHTAREAHAQVMKLYLQLTRRIPGSRVIIMGDSAGGGFSLALAQEIRDLNQPLPGQLVLISPWVDITGGDKAIQEHDTWLSVDICRLYGLDWADSLDPHDPMVSPLYGAMEGLPPTSLFAGAWEVFCTDIVTCSEKMTAAGVPTTLHVASEMGHVYPLYPAPEGRKARQTITGII